MDIIFRGTTPTFTFTFKDLDMTTISLSNIVVADEKTTEVYTGTIDVENKTISKQLTQADTLKFNGRAKVQLEFKTTSDYVWKSDIYFYNFNKSLHDVEL